MAFPEVAGSVIQLLMDFLGDTNTASALDVVFFVREIMETNQKLRGAILARLLVLHEGSGSQLAITLGNDFKGWISLVFYLAGIAAAFVHTGISIVLYVMVAMIWFIPDRRIERTVALK